MGQCTKWRKHRDHNVGVVALAVRPHDELGVDVARLCSDTCFLVCDDTWAKKGAKGQAAPRQLPQHYQTAPRQLRDSSRQLRDKLW